MKFLGKLLNSLPLDRTTWPLVRRGIVGYTRRHIGKIAIAIALMAIASAGMSAVPLFLERVIDDSQRQVEFGSTLLLGLAFLAVFLLRGFANLGQEAIMSFVGNRIVADIQTQMYAHVMRADLAYFYNNPSGQLISNFVNDTTKMRTVFADTITGIGRDFLTLLFLIVVMFYQDWILACIVFFSFPLAAIPIDWLGRKMRRVSGRTQEEMAQFTTVLGESFQGARHVKANNMEDFETRRATRVIDKIFRLNYKATLIRGINDPILEMFAGVAVIALMSYAGWQIALGAKTMGDYVAFIAAFMLAYEPVRKLARLYANLQLGLAATERVFRTLDRHPEIVEKPDARALEVGEGEVRLANVSFAYHENAPALENVSIDAPAGCRIALVGPSGAGKSSVLNLIPRFFDVQNGAVLIDGQDVRDVTFRSLRDSIALVSQETNLFDDTVRANIAYGKPEASEEDVVAAAKAAAAHDFIQELPEGYDTHVGGLGIKLSGGQRQRISIARAIIKDAPILLLDEATSALDTESERQVQTALNRLSKGRTTIVIAHRLSTVLDADVLYVMDRGRVVETGSHKALLAKGGVYAGLYATQMAGLADEDARDGQARAAGE